MSYSFSDKGDSSLPRDDEEDDENTIKIMVATDCHVGYAEKDGIRHSDSLNTFEEILQHAKKNQVDMILLGGDLFHENKPSRKALHGVMALIRQYCMGDRPVQIQFLSDQSLNFAASPFPVVNYEDPNINVEIPVFSIHGNHDDPAGLGNLCALDILSVSGLVNYFGKCNSLESIDVTPLLIQKGTTRLSLYGIGSIRDERMHRIFVSRKIRFYQPKEEDNPWFHLLVLHQNRTKHGETNYIPEQFLPDFVDLVLWGHEHECKIDPAWNDRQHFFVTQPGSSIATSLCQGESVQKHICLLKVRGKALKCTKIRLETVRPFYMRDICLQDTDLNPGHAGIQDKVEAYCSERVEGLLSLAEDEHTGNPKQPKLPLIRLRVDYSGGFETFNINRFGQKFVDRVANTKDLILFHRRKLQPEKRDVKPSQDMANYLRPDALDAGRVEDLVKLYFSDAEERKQLCLLSEKGLGQAIQEFVDKEERDAIAELVKYQLDSTQGHLKIRKTSDTFILEELKHFKEQRKKMSEADQSKEVRSVMEKAKEKRLQQGGNYSDDDDDDNDQDMPSDDSDRSATQASRPGRGKGRGRGRGQGQGSTARSGRARGSRAGTRGGGGRTKQSVLTNSFLQASKPTSRTSRAFGDSDDSEDKSFSPRVATSSASSRRNTNQRSAKRSAVQFLDSGDSEEEDDFEDFPTNSPKNKPSTSKRGRRN